MKLIPITSQLNNKGAYYLSAKAKLLNLLFLIGSFYILYNEWKSDEDITLTFSHALHICRYLFMI